MPVMDAAANLPAEKLVCSFPTALNQNDQQHDGDNAGNNPDNCCVVHVSSPFLLEVVKKLRHLDHGRSQGDEKD